MIIELHVGNGEGFVQAIAVGGDEVEEFKWVLVSKRQAVAPGEADRVFFVLGSGFDAVGLGKGIAAVGFLPRWVYPLAV